MAVSNRQNNLFAAEDWKIAYKIYGDGWKYIEIFDSNKEQISNPDLIFPGQIFLLPKN